MPLHAEHAPRPVTLAWLDAEEAIILRWPGIEGPPGDPAPERLSGVSSSWRRFSTASPPGSHPTTTSCCLARARCASGLPPSSGRAIPGRGARDRSIPGPPAG